jgi:hypothetical protein
MVDPIHEDVGALVPSAVACARKYEVLLQTEFVKVQYARALPQCHWHLPDTSPPGVHPSNVARPSAVNRPAPALLNAM